MKNNEYEHDDEFLYEDEQMDVLVGSVQSAGDHSALADLLLELTSASTKVAILMSELDEDEYRGIAPRLVAFLSMVQQIPTTARRRRKIGFKPSSPSAKTKSAPNQKAKRQSSRRRPAGSS